MAKKYHLIFRVSVNSLRIKKRKGEKAALSLEETKTGKKLPPRQIDQIPLPISAARQEGSVP